MGMLLDHAAVERVLGWNSDVASGAPRSWNGAVELLLRDDVASGLAVPEGREPHVH